MTLLLRLSLFALIACVSQSAWAQSFCDMQTAVSAYKAALARKERGDVESAHRTFMKLAENAHAPAQRHVAEYFFSESRDKLAFEQAIKWAQLAAWGGDTKATALLKQAIDASRHSVVEAGLRWASNWRAKESDCFVPVKEDQTDFDFQSAGRFPVIRHEDLDEDEFAAMVTRLDQALQAVGQVAPYFQPLVELIPAFEVVAGHSTDRYLAWQEDENWMVVSSGFLGDSTVRQLAYSLVLGVQRQLFSQTADADFNDQVGARYGKTRLIGSVYGDVKTDRFLEMFQSAIKKARNLPTVLRDKVYLIDEIRYMPPSKYHDNRFSNEKHFARYDRKVSRPEHRIMVINHKMAFETEEQLILEMVRIGEFAQQHRQIEAMKSSVNGKQREDLILKALEGNMKDVAKAFTTSTKKSQDQVRIWDEKGPENNKKMNCQARLSQVKAAKILKISPIIFRQSVDLGTCKVAKKEWDQFKSLEMQK